jgi:phosphohistidine phosphatase
MKTLLLLRHTKSSWADSNLGDHERPLNERGLRDAPRIGRWLAKIGQCPQLVLTSTAVRAKTTSALVIDEGELDCELVETNELYLAPPEAFLQMMQAVADDYECIMMVAHNPGIASLVELLTGEYESTPTGGLAHIELAVDRWSEVRLDGQAELIDFHRPKEMDC